MSYRPTYVRGEWKAICDICGVEYKASELQKRWDGFMVCSYDFEPRQPQDFVRGVADFQAPPYTRPESSDVFLPVTYQVYVQMGNYVYSGQNSKFSKSVTTSILPVTTGAYTYTGQVATLDWTKRDLVVTQGSYTFTGFTTGLYRGRYMPIVQGAYTYTGNASTLSIGKGLPAAQGSYTYTGEAVTFTVYQSNKTLTALQGSYTYTGEAATVTHNRSLTVVYGAYTYTGTTQPTTYTIWDAGVTTWDTGTTTWDAR